MSGYPPIIKHCQWLLFSCPISVIDSEAIRLTRNPRYFRFTDFGLGGIANRLARKMVGFEEERIANLQLYSILRPVHDYDPGRHQSKRLQVVRFGPALNDGPMSAYQG